MISGRVGAYGVTPSNMLGVKPPMSRPRPLSIQVAAMRMARDQGSSFMLSRNLGGMSSARLVMARMAATHMK